jgi:hypothetical protein
VTFPLLFLLFELELWSDGTFVSAAEAKCFARRRTLADRHDWRCLSARLGPWRDPVARARRPVAAAGTTSVPGLAAKAALQTAACSCFTMRKSPPRHPESGRSIQPAHGA